MRWNEWSGRDGLSAQVERNAQSAETCNGEDDDCDGVIDNIPAAACQATPNGCQVGFTVDGIEKCATGSPFTKYCAVKSQGDFCKICDNTPTCGYCGGAVGCDPGGPNYCVPGTSCVFNGSAYVCQTINGCGAGPNCYLPKTVKDRANQCF